MWAITLISASARPADEFPKFMAKEWVNANMRDFSSVGCMRSNSCTPV